MADSPPTYRRLPGRGANLASYVSLYEAGDHLLQVTTTGFTESYKRFFFRDIQAVTIRWSSRHNVYSTLFAALTLVFALPGALSLMGNVDAAMVLFVIAACFAGGLAVNLALGPACICEMKTAVQTERLTGLNRVRRAQKFLNRLKPLIDDAQGPLPPEMLSTLVTEAWRAAAFEAAHPGSAYQASPASPAPNAAADASLPPISPAP